MLHFVPELISSNSAAETRVFALLQRLRLDGEWYCYHSLNLPEHIYKRNGEIDFLLLGPRQMYCLEVKGGRISCKDGMWTYLDRYEKHHQSSEGPFRQAQSAMYSLRNRLREHVLPEPEAAMIIGFGVIFPDCDMHVSGLEWSNEIVLTESDMSENGFARFLARLDRYWGRNHPPLNDLTEVQSKDIRNFLRPDFEMVPSLRARLNGTEQLVVSLTDRQYEILDSLSSMPRILCRGCAGSGKTLLALESARRNARRGRSVLLLCANPVLAAVLSTRLREENVSVCAMGEFRHRTLHGKHGDLQLPFWAKPQSFDLLIVDEAQDCLTFAHLQLFDTVLKDGIAKGRWQIFCDPENQKNVYGEMDTDALEYLQACNPGTPELTKNCRNTNLIVNRTLMLTGISVGEPDIKSSEQVETVWYGSPDEQVRQVAALLQVILDKEKLPPGDVALLTMASVTTSPVINSSIGRRTGVRILDEYSLPEYPFQSLMVSSVRHFKGLDNKIVILTDIENLDDTAKLYVAMTRARSKLYLFVNKHLQNEISHRIELFVDRITAGGDHGLATFTNS